MERPGAAQDPGSELQRVSHQGTITVTAVPPRGIVDDKERCQLCLCSPGKSGRVTLHLYYHLLMEVSGKKGPRRLQKSCSHEMMPQVKQRRGREGVANVCRATDSKCLFSPAEAFFFVLVSCCYQLGLARWHYCKMRQLLCRNGRL